MIECVKHLTAAATCTDELRTCMMSIKVQVYHHSSPDQGRVLVSYWQQLRGGGAIANILTDRLTSNFTTRVGK